MVRRLPALLLGSLLVLTAPEMLTAPKVWAKTEAGDLLWEDQVDFAGGADAALAVAASDGRVVAVGSAQNTAANTDFVVRAYDAKTGALLWKDQVNAGGANDAASAVVIEGDTVVVGGTSQPATGGPRLILRAYAAKTGKLLWEDRSALQTFNGLASVGSRVLITGTTATTTGTTRLFVRGYVTKTGVIAWQDRPAPPLGYDNFIGAPRGLVVNGHNAYVTGTVAGPGATTSCHVRSYDAPDGHLSWATVHVSPCRAFAIAADGKRVIVAGQGSFALDDLHVQAYDADNGGFLWEMLSGVGTGFSNAVVAADLEHRLTFVAGWIRWVPGSFNQEAFLVRAYDSATGVLRWEDQYPGIDPFVHRCLCHARDLVTQGNRVFAVGIGAFNAGPLGTWVVRSYTARDGDLLWNDEFQPVGGVGTTPFGAAGGLAVAVDGGRAFVAGAGLNAAGNADFTLRAYDAK
jgi:putative pyrroloquinoline-quinone binding quinoprotein